FFDQLVADVRVPIQAVHHDHHTVLAVALPKAIGHQGRALYRWRLLRGHDNDRLHAVERIERARLGPGYVDDREFEVLRRELEQRPHAARIQPRGGAGVGRGEEPQLRGGLRDEAAEERFVQL